MKKLHTILLVLGVAFLGYLLWSIGVRELWRELGLLGWGLVPLLLSEGVGELIHTLGWRRCLSGPQRALPFGLLFRIRMAGYAINYLTPTAALGGEVTRATLLSSYGHAPQVVSGLLVDKACIAVAHLLWVIIGAGVILWQVKLPVPLGVAMVLAALLLAAGITAFLLLQIYGKLGAVVRWLARHRIGGARRRHPPDLVVLRASGSACLVCVGGQCVVSRFVVRPAGFCRALQSRNAGREPDPGV